MMGMFCEDHFNNLTKTKELLNFPICWMHYKLEREPSITNWRERCLDLMFIIKLQSRMLKRSIVCFELESRVWDSLLEDIRSSCEERGSMVSGVSLVNCRQYYSYFWSFNNLKSKLHLILIYLQTSQQKIILCLSFLLSILNRQIFKRSKFLNFKVSFLNFYFKRNLDFTFS